MELEKYVKNKNTLKILNKENIFSVQDALNNFPHKFINYEVIDKDGIYLDKIMIKGTINGQISQKNYRTNLSSLSFEFCALGTFIEVIIFNRNFLKDKLLKKKEFYVYGKYEYYNKKIIADNIFFDNIEKIEIVYQGNINKNYKYIIEKILADYNKKDILPISVRKKYRLIDEKTMYKYAHMPEDMNQVKEFYRRIKYQELFLFEMMLEYKKLSRKKDYKEPKKYDIIKIKEFISKIPFELTADQKKCVNEIFIDLKSDHASNRLIQGDVGSGKTIVCALAMYACITAGYQAALMVPTEILAKQHYFSLCKLFNNVIRVELITSSIKGKKREELLNDLKEGKIDLLIGTHAIITDNVEFKKLGIVVIDEQHRFGVIQRQALKYKGENPDVLFLSATPIPRTLAISLFGDMDLSIIMTKPSGRKPVITKYILDDEKEYAFKMLDEELKKGHQAYVISPLIEDENETNLSDIKCIYEELSNRFNYKIGILHGKMKPKEKEEIMNEFNEGLIDILLSTTVVEVGVDVANATFILIYDGERFGLSQLHQLRGRVGRNSFDNYCVVLSKKSDKERLKIIESVYDGFKLAEEDLRMRGPGDFFGSKQSGMPTFKVANLIDDFKILECAKNDASNIIKNIYDEDYKDLLNYLIESNASIE